jgi:4-carboxymuconolactone decarboxylase
MTSDRDRRQKGLEKMAAVYGWPPVTDSPDNEFFGVTVEHLFADIWTRDLLTVRQRRLLLLGALMASGDFDVIGMQIDAAYRLGELDADQLRELAIFMAHYVGWPRATKLNTEVEKVLAKQPEAAHTKPSTKGSHSS